MLAVEDFFDLIVEVFICGRDFFLLGFNSVDLDFIGDCTGCIVDLCEFKFVFEGSNGIIGDGFDVIVECSLSDFL